MTTEIQSQTSFCQVCGDVIESAEIDGTRCRDHMYEYKGYSCPDCGGDIYVSTGDPEFGCPSCGFFCHHKLAVNSGDSSE